MHRSTKITSLPLFIVGILLIIVGLYLFNSTNQFKKSAELITAVISNTNSHRDSKGNETHYISVDYKYRGEMYKGIRIDAYNSSMFTGKKIDIYVNTNCPSEARYLTYWNALFFGGIGIIVFLSGLGILFIDQNGTRQKEKYSY